jgi:23S rRNA-intervening sequence protein
LSHRGITADPSVNKTSSKSIQSHNSAMLANSNTKYQLLLARDLEYISEDTYEELRSGYDRVIQMLSRLSQSLGNDPRTRSRSEGQSRPRHDE